MDSLYRQLDIAHDEDSTWTSQIRFDIPTPPVILKAMIMTKTTIEKELLDVTTTDIVPLFSLTSDCISFTLEHELKYPTGALFCFYRYKGIDNYKILYQYLIDTATSTDGT